MRLFKFIIDDRQTCYSRVRPPGWTDNMKAASSVTGEEIPDAVRLQFSPAAMKAFQEENGQPLHSVVVDIAGGLEPFALAPSSGEQAGHYPPPDEEAAPGSTAVAVEAAEDETQVEGDIALD